MDFLTASVNDRAVSHDIYVGVKVPDLPSGGDSY
jgi:hypothetical protein